MLNTEWRKKFPPILLHPLEFFAQGFEQDIGDKSRYQTNYKIGHRKNIAKRPQQAILLTGAGTLEFSHQEICVKQEQNKSHFNQEFPDKFIHSRVHLQLIA